MGEQAELRDGQAERLDIAVIDLGDAPRGLAQPQTGAAERGGRGYRPRFCHDWGI